MMFRIGSCRRPIDELVIHPPVDADRLQKIETAAGTMAGRQCSRREHGTPGDRRGRRLFRQADARGPAGRRHPCAWVQSPTASLEHYIFPELVAHPAVLTNMRGLYWDVIAEHVLGLVCFTRNLHTYIHNQLAGRWEPVGGEASRVSFA